MINRSLLSQLTFTVKISIQYIIRLGKEHKVEEYEGEKNAKSSKNNLEGMNYFF